MMATIAELIDDVASTLGHWMPADALVDHVVDRFGVNRRSVQRMVSRMIADGRLLVRRGWATQQGATGKPITVPIREVRAVRVMWETVR